MRHDEYLILILNIPKLNRLTISHSEGKILCCGFKWIRKNVRFLQPFLNSSKYSILSLKKIKEINENSIQSLKSIGTIKEGEKSMWRKSLLKESCNARAIEIQNFGSRGAVTNSLFLEIQRTKKSKEKID